MEQKSELISLTARISLKAHHCPQKELLQIFKAMRIATGGSLLQHNLELIKNFHQHVSENC